MLTNNIAEITEKLMRSRASKLEKYVKRTPTVKLSSEKLKKIFIRIRDTHEVRVYAAYWDF